MRAYQPLVSTALDLHPTARCAMLARCAAVASATAPSPTMHAARTGAAAVLVWVRCSTRGVRASA